MTHRVNFSAREAGANYDGWPLDVDKTKVTTYLEMAYSSTQPHGDMAQDSIEQMMADLLNSMTDKEQKIALLLEMQIHLKAMGGIEHNSLRHSGK